MHTVDGEDEETDEAYTAEKDKLLAEDDSIEE